MSGICPLCERPLGKRVERHHVVPKSKGGKEVVGLHPVCHRKIHKVFANRELAQLGTIAALRENEDIAKFIRWVAKRPQNFHSRTR